jgi:ATP-dependent protease ClpP protease subunit
MSVSKKRKILLLGEVNEEMYRHFTSKLDLLISESYKPVLIELVSEGGDPNIALAISGRMRTCGCQVNVDAFGIVQSAAVAILAAGDFRRLSNSASVMVHDSSDSIKGRVSQIKDKLAELNAEERRWCKLLEEQTGTPALVWYQLHSKESYLTPSECLQLGLCDELMKGAPRPC